MHYETKMALGLRVTQFKTKSKFAKPENSATGPSTAATRLEIWHMFNMLVLLYYRQVNKYNQIKKLVLFGFTLLMMSTCFKLLLCYNYRCSLLDLFSIRADLSFCTCMISISIQ